MSTITGKSALITGGGSGIGLGCAIRLVQDGAHVTICGRTEDKLVAAVDVIAAQAADGATVRHIVADVTVEDEIAAANAFAAEVTGGLDILVANAGGPPSGGATATSVDAYRSAIELNLLSAIAMVLGAAPTMREQGWGRILAITSIGVRQPIPFLAASVTARAGATGFLKTLATEVAPDGITVNSIQPGSHATDRLRSLHGTDFDDLVADIPSGVIGDPDDFGAMAAFLCSEQAKFVTGTSLLVDGGASRGLL